MADPLYYELFSNTLSSVYRAVLSAEKTDDEISDLRSQGNWRHFSITLRGPADIFLPQGMRALLHEQQPDGLDIFLVPVGRDTEGFIYEAVFNYQVNQT
jgi:hypothetical protein